MKPAIPDNVPESCKNGNHNYGQAGRCHGCGADRVTDREIIRNDRKTGGAGALTNPLSDDDYRRERRKLGGGR